MFGPVTESWLTAGTYQEVVGSAVLVIQRGGMPHDLPVQAGFFNPITLALYRELLPDVLVVRLTLGLEEARRRAAQRTVYITDAEFEELHRQQGDNLQVDHELDVADMGIDEQVAAVMKIWTAG